MGAREAMIQVGFEDWVEIPGMLLICVSFRFFIYLKPNQTKLKQTKMRNSGGYNNNHLLRLLKDKLNLYLQSLAHSRCSAVKCQSLLMRYKGKEPEK